MQLKQFLAEDDGVSPVIGVILMVAITVILAAVIASFVLGLGGSADEVQPNTSFDLEYEAVDSDDWSALDDSELDYVVGSPSTWDGSGSSTEVPLSADGGNGLLTISVTSGQSVEASELYIRGDQLINDTDDFDANDEIVDEISVGDLGTSEEFSSGQGFTIAVASDFDITLVWEATDSDDSATLAERSGPDA